MSSYFLDGNVVLKFHHIQKTGLSNITLPRVGARYKCNYKKIITRKTLNIIHHLKKTGLSNVTLPRVGARYSQRRIESQVGQIRVTTHSKP